MEEERSDPADPRPSLNELFSATVQQALRSMTDPAFVAAFASVARELKSFVVLLHNCSTSRKRKTNEELLVEVDTLSDPALDECFSLVRQSVAPAAPRQSTPGIPQWAKSPVVVFCFVVLVLSLLVVLRFRSSSLEA